MITMHQKKRTPIRSIVATLVLMGGILLALLPATPAAATTMQYSGSVGGVYEYKVQGMHYNSCPNQAYTCENPRIYVPAPYIYRAPALSGNQTILHMTNLYRLINGAWVVVDTHSELRTLRAGTTGGYVRAEDFYQGQTGAFRIIVAISWLNPAQTRILGTRYVIYSQLGDYQCVGRSTAQCSAGNGYVFL
ncbi:hypothetical protein [Arthrobacter livingstonensis]|nr:hypothetical protein [Arthrobacter livingstonensis]